MDLVVLLIKIELEQSHRQNLHQCNFQEFQAEWFCLNLTVKCNLLFEGDNILICPGTLLSFFVTVNIRSFVKLLDKIKYYQQNQ